MPKKPRCFLVCNSIFRSTTQNIAPKSPDKSIWATSGFYLGWLNLKQVLGLVHKSPDTQRKSGYGLGLQKSWSQKIKQVMVKLNSGFLGWFFGPHFFISWTPIPNSSGFWVPKRYNETFGALGVVKTKAQIAPRSRPDISIWAFFIKYKLTITGETV